MMQNLVVVILNYSEMIDTIKRVVQQLRFKEHTFF